MHTLRMWLCVHAQAGHTQICGMGPHVQGESTCMCLVRSQGEWAVYKGIPMLGCSGIHSVEDKTINGRTDVRLRVTTSQLSDLGQVTSSL